MASFLYPRFLGNIYCMVVLLCDEILQNSFKQSACVRVYYSHEGYKHLVYDPLAVLTSIFNSLFEKAHSMQPFFSSPSNGL